MASVLDALIVMEQKTVTATVIVAAGLTAFMLIGTGAATAAPIAEAPTLGNGIDYGDNAHGWHVIVHNESDLSLPVFVVQPLISNVSHREGTAGAHHTAHVYGVESIFTGPANMFFEYRPSLEFDDILRHVHVSVSAAADGAVHASCSTRALRGVSCEVTKQESNQPIEVVIRNNH